jgi:hypothetical protein
MNLNWHYIYKLIISASLVLPVNGIYAQDPISQDSVVIMAPDTAIGQDTINLTSPVIARKDRFGVYIDILGIAGQFLTTNKKYEGGVYFTAYRNFLLVLEGGNSILQPKSSLSNGEYRAEGNYWKAGMDYIINYNRESDTKIYVGARYANSAFEDRGDYEVASSLWPSYRSSFFREDLTAEWYEILAGTEGNLFGSFYTGWIIRYRIMLESPQLSPIPVYNIPGFGPGNSKSAFAFNFYLKYQIKW